MLKLMSFMLLISFSAKSFSQSCVDELLKEKRTSYISRMDENGRNMVGLVSTGSGFVIGIAVAGTAIPAFLIAVGIAATPILVDEGIAEIHNRPIKRMVKLIMESRALVNDPASKPGKILKKLHKRIQREHGDLSIEELAYGIVAADESEDCGSIRRVKEIQRNIDSGRLPVVQL